MVWQKTSCCLCFTNCGLEVNIENNRITKVRPDKSNPRSRGYCCRKGLNIAHYQHHEDRLSTPLKKEGDEFVPISWERAISEISDKLKAIVAEHGPKSYAYMGSGGQGCHLAAAMGPAFMRSLGSQYYYSSAAQEWSGEFWVNGRVTGIQPNKFLGNHHNSEVMLAVGWNGMQSHSIPRTPVELKAFAKNPDKTLIVIDPRLSETARIANIHLALRPGTDALLTRALIAIILEEGWHNPDYVDRHTSGFEAVRPWFENFDIKGALDVCELPYEEVKEVCRLFATRKSCLHSDLGILMNRHSTVTSYLHLILLAICGRLCVPGGNILPGHVAPMGNHTDDRDENTWRTLETNIPAVCGYFPPNVLPEEIMSENPEHIRAVIVSSTNPLRSYADTKAYAEAFKKLDLLVCVELSMTETAVLADYVLPARSGYEAWETTFFAWNYPEIFSQLRHPVITPDGDQLEVGEIFLRLAEAMGFIPDIPKSLYDVAEKGYGPDYLGALMSYVSSEPAAQKAGLFVIGKTLGRALDSVHLASLYALLQNLPPTFHENASRMGFSPGPELGDTLFQALLETPQGMWVGKCDETDMFAGIATEDNRLQLHIPELAMWVTDIDPETEKAALKPDPTFPLVLVAGRHFNKNANTLMRDPAWLKDRKGCTLIMHPSDAETFGLEDGQDVKVVTEAGDGQVALEVTQKARPGQVVLPHGFGLAYKGKTYGLNVNQLTKNTHRDRLVGTPLHRYVPCRVEKI